MFWGRILFKVSQTMSKYWCYEVESVFFLSRCCQEAPDWHLFHDFLTGKKLSSWVLETWDQHQKMPVNGGILIFVPPWWATWWTATRTSWGPRPQNIRKAPWDPPKQGHFWPFYNVKSPKQRCNSTVGTHHSYRVGIGFKIFLYHLSFIPESFSLTQDIHHFSIKWRQIPHYH